ncbi:MAG: uncharacterized protein PWP15_254 [Methanothermococcus sp.]|jgi:hypothetical protein|uniref:V4R domain-containing protein n=1 Tax=Methanothermococcus TaxID=155862 RepID=UPI000374B734|nr:MULTISPECIES: V4R domain-containing protein [Methanothermococcus]MDK2789747.1 uncharacterized protein [Methanothermococcus sp.]MDK2986962.1 uncharacterized protein [Methanothermococcus sp.]
MAQIPLDTLKNADRPILGNDIDITLFRIIRFADLEKYLGAGANAVLYASGKKFGESLGLKSVDDIIEFCRDNKIGIVEVVNEDPLQIRVNECITCAGMPKMDKILCHFEGGFIAGCLGNILEKKIHIKETHCAGLGDDFCQFEVKIL